MNFKVYIYIYICPYIYILYTCMSITTSFHQHCSFFGRAYIYIYIFILCPDNQTCILPSPSPIRPISLALGNLIRVMPSVRPWLRISSKTSYACCAGTFSRVPSVRCGILPAHGTPGSRAIALPWSSCVGSYVVWSSIPCHGKPNIPVVPHKAAAEVSKIGHYRRGELLWMAERILMGRKVVGVVFFGMVTVVAVVTSPTTARCSVV